jgi:hypothetical protein
MIVTLWWPRLMTSMRVGGAMGWRRVNLTNAATAPRTRSDFEGPCV